MNNSLKKKSPATFFHSENDLDEKYTIKRTFLRLSKVFKKYDFKLISTCKKKSHPRYVCGNGNGNRNQKRK